jgi:hypothetical protein
MGMPFHALNDIQLVAGCDAHKNLPPVPPAPAAHVVVAIMGMADSTTQKISTTVKANWGYALGRQHDLGRGPYHFAVNVLLPIVCLGAGNKAEFGCATVIVGNCGADNSALRMAAAAIPYAGLNLQLDCDEPLPLPTSICVASFNTVHVGMTFADLLAGLLAGAVDSILTWVVGKISGAIANAILGEVLGLLGPEALLLGWLLGADEIVKLPISWLIGTPLGYSYQHGWFGLGSTYGAKLNDFINDHVSPAPKPPKSPTTPPAGAAPSGSSGAGSPPAGR